MRRLVALAAVALAFLLVGCTPEEGTHLKAVNDFRAANHVPALAWEEGAYAKAHAWSQRMADQGKLSHSTLSQGIPAGWRTLGENVAVAPTLDGATSTLRASPGHRVNLLNPAFTKVAIGVVQKGGFYWVTEVFIG